MKKHYLAMTIAMMASNALHSNSVMAAAHLLPELGSLNASTAGAGSAALAESALTAWTNPAAMSQLEKTELTVNLAGLYTDIRYSDATPNERFDNNIDAGGWAPIASFYFVTPINDKFHAGFAFASQGGSGIDYGDNFSGQRLFKNVEFMTVQLMPSVSYKVNEQFSLGASVNAEYLTANGELNPIVESNHLFKAQADDLTVGYTLSAFYQPSEKHRFGFIYRSELAHYGEGDLQNTASATKHDVGLDFIMPQNIQISGVHSVNDQWDMLWSTTWYQLSTWTDLTLDVNDSSIQVVDRSFDDVWNLAIGTHYQITPTLRLETGISYETSPQNDATHQYLDLPVGETKRIGAGATYALNESWELRAYYDYIDLGKPELNYALSPEIGVQGSYDNSAHFFGIQANYRFL
ncbi:OmpP1/FadL family transporter [Vibrio methylphosphonaticus]|uniref:OmpP1/FadL family transporter n=1 Tax=Vibrio methylphosphonaticus TaxID=2946866 RepID=UPI00202A89C3|nr:outer membrane protein transport protein [Vibrio methylphosphonaticus]MCL9774211.1 outer membrane protein transport protein [Vibrio methylphosphonaticus]